MIIQAKKLNYAARISQLDFRIIKHETLTRSSSFLPYDLNQGVFEYLLKGYYHHLKDFPKDLESHW